MLTEDRPDPVEVDVEVEEGSLEARMPGYRFGIVLLLLLATFVVMAVAPNGVWASPLVVGLQGATLVTAFLACKVSKRWMRIATAIAVIALVASIGVAVADASTNRAVFGLLELFLVGATPVAIGRSIWKRGIVDAQTVLGAICIYVIIGMFCAFGYAIAGALLSDPFFVQTSHATTADFLYFSYVTQTTVGYGDLTAAGDLGRSIAVLEALTGQLYLVTIIAVLVARLATRPPPPYQPLTSRTNLPHLGNASVQPEPSDQPELSGQ